MKKFLVVLICIGMFLGGCSQNETKEIMNIGDEFSLSGIVEYSDKPSDVGQEYCFITGEKDIEYYYTDIYGEVSKWSSDVFYTKGDDTELLKDYVGRELTISGVFDAESHGIPYITDITIINE